MSLLPGAHDLWLFVAAGLLLNISPGPDMLYVIARSLAQGRGAGVMSALGIAGGCLVHAALAAFGISVLLRASPLAYELLKIAGAAYLLWLGIRTLRSAPAPGERAPPAAGMRTIWVQGFITNLFNPKVALFFLAFLPQFADPARGHMAAQMLLLGVIFIFNGFWVCWLVALGAAAAARWLRHENWQQRINRISGGVLIGLGLRLMLDKTR